MIAKIRYARPAIADRSRIAVRLQTVSSSPDSPVWRSADEADDNAR